MPRKACTETPESMHSMTVQYALIHRYLQSSISYLTGTSEEQYKVYVVSGVKEVVNVQQPGFATATGIYMTFEDADLGNATVNGNALSKDVQGSGIIAHLTNFTNMYSTVVVYNNAGIEKAVFYVYNAKATASETTTIVETETSDCCWCGNGYISYK